MKKKEESWKLFYLIFRGYVTLIQFWASSKTRDLDTIIEKSPPISTFCQNLVWNSINRKKYIMSKSILISLCLKKCIIMSPVAPIDPTRRFLWIYTYKPVPMKFLSRSMLKYSYYGMTLTNTEYPLTNWNLCP